jgi:hypothetical protein
MSSLNLDSDFEFKLEIDLSLELQLEYWMGEDISRSNPTQIRALTPAEFPSHSHPIPFKSKEAESSPYIQSASHVAFITKVVTINYKCK